MRTKRKKLVVLGAGESGTGAAVLGKEKGWEVFVSDMHSVAETYENTLKKHHIVFEYGAHTWSKICHADLAVKSPGIREDAPIVAKLRQKGIPVISEIEFAYAYSEADIIAVTGSNGKTTTATLIFHILNKAGLDVCLAGNIGKSFAMELAENDHRYFVLELSSFQLDGIVDFKPFIAIILNITPDHLDRYHADMNAYAASKCSIVKNQDATDYLIYCADDAVIRKHLKRLKIRSVKLPFSIFKQMDEGGCLKFPFSGPREKGKAQEGNEIIVKLKKQKFNMAIYQLALKGKHNLYNGMASGIAAKILEIENDTIRESLMDFQNIEHRLEFVSKVNGISYINDSKATNVHAVWYALETVAPPIIWLVGGEDKGNNYAFIKDLVKEKVKAIICIGADNQKLKQHFEKLTDAFYETTSMRQAVALSYQIGKKNDTVLLSPACASFDLYESYQDRGRQFKEAVRSL